MESRNSGADATDEKLDELSAPGFSGHGSIYNIMNSRDSIQALSIQGSFQIINMAAFGMYSI